MNFLRGIFAAPSEQAQNALKLGDRIGQQLREKKERVKTLADAENLLVDEEKCCKLMRTTIDRLSEIDQWHCLHSIADLGALSLEFEIVESYWKAFRQDRTRNLRHLYKIEKLENKLTPRPNIKVESVDFFLDGEVHVGLSEEVPEGEYRTRQAVQYFAGLLLVHCTLGDPRLREEGGIHPGADGNRYRFIPKPMGISHFHIDTLTFRKISTRCPTRDFLFNPERTFYQEYERIITQFIEESFANPQEFRTADNLSVVPTKSDLRAFLPSDHELVLSDAEEPEVSDHELVAETPIEAEEPEVGFLDVD